MLFLAMAVPWRWKGNSGGGRGSREGGGCVFRYVYNPSYPSTSITLVSYTAVLSIHKSSAGSGWLSTAAQRGGDSHPYYEMAQGGALTDESMMFGWNSALIRRPRLQLVIHPSISIPASFCSHGYGVQLIMKLLIYIFKNGGKKQCPKTLKLVHRIDDCISERKVSGFNENLSRQWASQNNFKQVVPKTKALQSHKRPLST